MTVTPQHFVNGSERFNVVTHLRDGRVVARGYAEYVVDPGVQLAVDVRVADLRMIEYVLQVEFYTRPHANISTHAPMNKYIRGNVVGMSIYYILAGTTLGIEVIAIGPP